MKLARLATSFRGNYLAALNAREGQVAAERVQRIMKAAVDTGNMTVSSTWGGVLAEYRLMSDGFVESLRNIGVFDRLLSDGMRLAPLRTKFAMVTTGATGATIGELNAKPLTSMALDVDAIEPLKSTSIIVLSRELVDQGNPAADGLFNAELKRSVVAATDQTFLADLYASVTPTASAGTSTANVLTDLAALLAAVDITATSRVYHIVSPAAAKELICKVGASGDQAFPRLGVNGGEILTGITTLTSDNLPTGAALMIVADGIMGNSDLVTVDGSEQADVEMVSSAPDSPPTGGTVMTGLWQHSLKALRAERSWGFSIVRTRSVHALSGATY